MNYEWSWKETQIVKKTILNILFNFIPSETLLFDDKGPPSWLTNKIKKKLFNENDMVFKHYLQNSNNLYLSYT